MERPGGRGDLSGGDSFVPFPFLAEFGQPFRANRAINGKISTITLAHVKSIDQSWVIARLQQTGLGHTRLGLGVEPLESRCMMSLDDPIR